MKIRRTAKWHKRITLKQLKHIKENTDGTLAGVKKVLAYQKEKRDDAIRANDYPGITEPCWECKEIARRLGEPV